jgi:hypothetical protein
MGSSEWRATLVDLFSVLHAACLDDALQRRERDKRYSKGRLADVAPMWAEEMV